tara:strand:- start:807 stop:1961 length:1155 start_codon:yes stop_codon:yes gene_type:complete
VKLPPLSLYVHLPWCVRKCPYCDFNSHTAGDATPKRRYLDALITDMEQESVRAGDRKVHSIFLGGGTPSLFAPDEIDRLLTAARQQFDVADDAEVSMEANPGTVECGAPAGYREAGVTRLSIGAQSFDDGMLQTLGRIHSSADIRRAVDDARAAGFDNFNIDLMHGLPGQSVDQAIEDLRAAIQLEPTHVSWYQLTLEPNTVFYARPPQNMPDDELAFEIQCRGQQLLADNAFEQYEVSAYARDGRRCRHNMNYWQFGDYLAVGAGAHGKITDDDSIYRYHKPANPLQYMHSRELDDEAAALVPLEAVDRVFDFMLNALRLNDGFAEQLFVDRTGLAVADLEQASRGAVERGLLTRSDDKTWRPTELGRRFLNDLQSEFISGAG